MPNLRWNNHDRQAVAQENLERRNKRSNADQIAVLDKRLGKDVGAVKERARLNA